MLERKLLTLNPLNEMTHYPSLAKNYGATPFNAIKGSGVMLHDDEGNEYLDFTSGIAVTALGHSHPEWIKAVQAQLEELVHCSNLFGIPAQQALADKLISLIGKESKVTQGRVLFCNSGAEANEALMKLARLHGQTKSKGKEGECYEIVTAHNSFHGRTFGCMAATAQGKIQKGFRPMLKGFRHAELNNIESFKAQMDSKVAAVMIESIQGEGGIYPANKAFLVELKDLCLKHNCLLMIDEVQCGMGRTGDFFAYQESGIMPDAIGMAKGLGGGFPIGAIWISETYGELFQPGSHGTTFGGNPLASAAANAVIDIIKKEGLLENVTNLSKGWHNQLQNLQSKYPTKISAIRGRGFMVGIGVDNAPKVVELARDNGLLIVPAGINTIRLLPPLISNESDLAKSVAILDAVFKAL